METYIDKTILRLKRHYSKDELVQAMTKKQESLETDLKAERQANIQLKQEVLDLQLKLAKLLKSDETEKAVLKERFYVKNLRDEIQSLRLKNRELKIRAEKLILENIQSKF